MDDRAAMDDGDVNDPTETLATRFAVMHKQRRP